MNNILLKRDLTAEQLTMVQTEFEEKKKSKGIMYALWFFTGGLGGHRYYLNDYGYAIGMTLTIGGLGFWTLADVFFIGKRAEKKNQAIERDIIENVKILTK